MNIRLLSDLHLEFGPINLPVLKGEQNDVLVLAGDVGLASRPDTYMPFLEEMSGRFQDVIYIMGNHEHYKSSMKRSLVKINREIQFFGGFQNVHAVNNLVVRVNDVSFICSTMWASFNKNDPMTMLTAQMGMNDFKQIRTGPQHEPYQRKCRPEDQYDEFLKAINFIFPAIKEEKAKGQRICVVTHHGPTWQSVVQEFRTDLISGAYASDLTEEILDSDPDIWVHGHTHHSLAYEVGNTAVVCNPRGYVKTKNNAGDTNPNFNSELRIAFI